MQNAETSSQVTGRDSWQPDRIDPQFMARAVQVLARLTAFSAVQASRSLAELVEPRIPRPRVKDKFSDVPLDGEVLTAAQRESRYVGLWARVPEGGGEMVSGNHRTAPGVLARLEAAFNAARDEILVRSDEYASAVEAVAAVVADQAWQTSMSTRLNPVLVAYNRHVGAADSAQPAHELRLTSAVAMKQLTSAATGLETVIRRRMAACDAYGAERGGQGAVSKFWRQLERKQLLVSATLEIADLTLQATPDPLLESRGLGSHRRVVEAPANRKSLEAFAAIRVTARLLASVEAAADVPDRDSQALLFALAKDLREAGGPGLRAMEQSGALVVSESAGLDSGGYLMAMALGIPVLSHDAGIA